MAEKKFDSKRAGKRRQINEPKPRLGPLTPAEFRSVFGKVKSLGLTWTADIPPRLTAKKPRSEAVIPSLQVMRIEQRYPMFPRELGTVIFYILTGARLFPQGGDGKILEKKASVVRDSGLITEGYRAEFFFKHAIKVPYFSDLDWEVVVKKYERNVRKSPGISYALLSLQFEGPEKGSNRRRRMVVAVNERITGELIESLTQVKEALAKSGSADDILPEKAKLEVKDNAGTDSPDLLADRKQAS